MPRAVSMIKERFPDSIVCTDVALDPYSDQGHDGVVKDGKILNDETIMQLTKQVMGGGGGGYPSLVGSHQMISPLTGSHDLRDEAWRWFLGEDGACVVVVMLLVSWTRRLVSLSGAIVMRRSG